MSDTGAERIRRAFQTGQSAAFMPYLTLGYPDPETSLQVIEACCRAGADIMELGIPFSDPLADGPSIQASTQAAIRQGMTVRRCLESVRTLRERGVDTPFLLMGYTNPMLRYGLETFVRDSEAAGVDGFIVPDLPPEESGELRRHCRESGLGLIHMLAPNSPEDRVDLVLSSSPPFVYLVSLMGVTGARSELPPGLQSFIRRVRQRDESGAPLAVGFGIATPDQAAAVGREADGVIVGSALVNCVRAAFETGEDPALAAADFVRSLSASLIPA